MRYWGVKRKLGFKMSNAPERSTPGSHFLAPFPTRLLPSLPLERTTPPPFSFAQYFSVCKWLRRAEREKTHRKHTHTQVGNAALSCTDDIIAVYLYNTPPKRKSPGCLLPCGTHILGKLISACLRNFCCCWFMFTTTSYPNDVSETYRIYYIRLCYLN